MSNEEIPPCSKSVRLTTNEYLELVRDARRFRRMERAHRTPCNGHGWGEKMHDFEPPAKPLAEIADALPEVEG